jgi:hypothetical protein
MPDLSKRYYLFAYDGYYPSGGLGDLVFTSDFIEDIEKEYQRVLYCNDFVEMYDTKRSVKLRDAKYGEKA